MKTLYVSDLDGTLLNSSQKTSNYTNQTIKELVDKGMYFSYATARSYYSSAPVTKGLEAKFPIIVYNGCFVLDNKTHEILISNYLEKHEIDIIKQTLNQYHFHPIVYTMLEGKEKFLYLNDSSKQQLNFIQTRNDQRKTLVSSLEQLYQGDIFYISCIGDDDILKPIYELFKDQFQCLYSKDIYTNDTWLEILPRKATKANAILELKKHLGCDKVVVFGDGNNDLSMFEIGDECYAVENACDELKEKATKVIGHHDDDAVAKFLKEHYQC